MVETIVVDSNKKLCIICLEELNDNIMEACDKCDINCHNSCLYKWYIKNNVESCPICLKKTDIHNIVKHELFKNREQINDENNIDINNNNTIQYLYDTEEEYRKDKIASYILLATLILTLIMILSISL